MMDWPEMDGGCEPDVDARLLATLKGFDKELREAADNAWSSTDTSLQTAPEFSGALHCLQLLERVWPRGCAADDAVKPAEHLGGFRIERVLGQGGFGIVYLATDLSLGRSVALKVPRLHALAEPRLVERFQRESRAAAGLDHPHINPVYEAGEADGVYYIASAYCPGPTLAAWIGKEFPTGAPPRLAASLVAMLADGVAYSHARGVLHRDIKPSNVLLVERDPEQSGSAFRELTGAVAEDLPFSPRLTDFGLAKMMADAVAEGAAMHGETAGSLMLGTPAYMAPEQVQRRPDRNSPAADIYALGAVLYELLTGRPPFQGANVADLLEQVRRAELLPPRQLRRAVPRDLETICLKCLERDPSRRYATADQLRDDLVRFLQGRPIRARPPGLGARLIKAVRRRPITATAVTLCGLALLSFVGQRTWHAAQMSRVNQTLVTTNVDLNVALAQSQELQLKLIEREEALLEQLYVTALRDVQQDITHLRIERARQLLRTFIPEAQDQIDVRGVEWDYLWAEVQGPSPARVFSHDGIPVLCGALSPDGRVAVTGDDLGWLRVWDLATGVERASWAAHDTRVVSLRFSPDGRHLASGGSYHWLHVWSTDTWQAAQSIEAHDGTVQSVDFSADGELIATGGRDGQVRVWDWRRGEPLREGAVTGDDENVMYQVRFSPSGKRLYSATRHGKVLEWATDAMTSTETQLLAPTHSVRGADLSRDGRLFVAAGINVSFQRTDDGVTAEYPVTGMLNAAAASADGRKVGVGGTGGQIQVFDLSEDLVSGISERRWFGHDRDVKGVALSGDGRWLLTASDDGTAKLWDAGQLPKIGRTLLGSPEMSLSYFSDLDISSDGRFLAATAHGTLEPGGRPTYPIVVYDLKSMSIRHVLESEGCQQSMPQFSPDGERLYVRWQMDGEERIASWEVQSGAGPQIEELAAVEQFVVLPDTVRIVAAHTQSGGSHVAIWNTQTQQIERELLPSGGRVLTLDLSGDGSWLAVARDQAPIAVINLRSGESRSTGSAADGLTVAALDQRGERVAAVAQSDVRIYEAASNHLLASLPVHGNIVVPGRLSFSPRGNLLAISAADAAGSDAPSVLLWNFKSHRELHGLPTIGRHPWNLTWLPDGSGFATATRPTTERYPGILIWHLSDPAMSMRSSPR